MSSHPEASHPRGDLHNPDVAHEESDINLRALVWFVVMLVVVVLAVDVVSYGMFRLMNHYETVNEPFVSPLAAPAGQKPPEPRLQETPWTDLNVLRAQEHQYLTSYGWVDEKLGVARIPISKAKEMLLQRGIPVRPELGDPKEGTPVFATGESNGGRTIPAGQADMSSVPAAAGAPPAAAPAPAATSQPVPAKKPGGGL
jgi:hypothetical protein